MPLIKSGSDAARSKNIAAEVRSGKPKDVAVAIAYRVQRDAKRKKMSGGGSVSAPKYAGGGSLPFAAREGARNLSRAGMINGASAGRMDKLPMGVKSGSYIIPSDIVSGLGQGNSMAGARALNQMFKTAPFGAAAGKTKSVRPRMPRLKGFADGGDVGTDVDIMASDGEFVVPPEAVAELGGGSIENGHGILDSFVTQMRQKNIKTLKRLPAPKKS